MGDDIGYWNIGAYHQEMMAGSIGEELKKGKLLGDTTYRVHLGGYNQMDMITGKAPSNRHEVWYLWR